MSMTNQDRKATARELARKIFGEPMVTANLNLDDLTAAVASLDDSMDTILNTLPAAWGTKTVKEALIDALPEPFQSTSTPQQKAMVLSLWAMKESGII
jgi:hypothetical protein